MRSQPRISTTDRRRGAILPLVALLLMILFACAALAVDIAYMQMVRIELKASVDAAARAGGEALMRTQKLDEAKVAAKHLAALNEVAGAPLLLSDAQIVPGHSTFSQSTSKWNFVPSVTPYNSIRVIGQRTRLSPSGSVPLFFGRLFGHDDFEFDRQATVVRLDRDLMLVVDRSSSMKLAIDHPTGNMSTSDPRFSQAPWNDSRWVALEGAVQEFVTALGETPQVEWVGLVSYASDYNRFGVNNQEAEINQTLTENHALVNQQMAVISGTVFNGLTNIAAGIDEGVVALFAEGTSRPFAAKTMVLMTDGIPNPSNPAQVRARATVAADRNVKIYTVTFGDAADQGLMRDVADIGSGEHYHADNESQLDEIFRQIALTIPLTFTD